MYKYKCEINSPSSLDYETCTIERFVTTVEASDPREAKVKALAWVQNGGFNPFAAVTKVSLIQG